MAKKSVKKKFTVDKAAAAERVRKILPILKKTYPHAATALHFRDPLELLIATILSAQCTDVRVNRVTPELFKKYKSAADVPDGRARSRHFGSQRPLTRHGEAGCEEETFNALAAIGDVCRRLERTMVDVALAWCLQQPGISCVIAGASSQEQVAQNVYSFDNPLPGDAVSELNEATAGLKHALGPNPDMWEGAEKSRFR